MTLVLRNPHSVLAAVHRRPHGVREVRLSAKPSDVWQQVAEAASQAGVAVVRSRSEKGRRQRGQRSGSPGDGRGGGSEARVEQREDTSLDELFDVSGPDDRGLWLALDRLQDPHNVGAVFRSAAFFGVRGVVVTKDQSAPLNTTVYDVASGGLEHVPFAVVPNLARALEVARESGLWTLGSSEHADQDVHTIERDRPWLLVVGSEEKGLRRLTREKCDVVCRIPAAGEIRSLNVSVATAVLLSILTTARAN